MYFLIKQPQNHYISGFTFDHLKSHRVAIGENFLATDLNGHVLECRLISFDKKGGYAEFDVISKKRKDTVLNSVLIQAIPDKNYLDKLIEVATLAGFAKILLFQSDFSPKYNLNLERISKISLQSALLAEFTQLPSIEVFGWDDLIQNVGITKQSILLTQFGQSDSKILKLNSCKDGVCVWVGPEGGWSVSENQTFDALDIAKLSLAQGVIYPAWLAGSVWKFGWDKYSPHTPCK